jgi:hypothetical protein
MAVVVAADEMARDVAQTMRPPQPHVMHRTRCSTAARQPLRRVL